MKKTKWPGNWKFSCHVCGMWYPSGEIKKRWDGLYVCHKDWEVKHPQLFIKVRAETAVPSYISKDGEPEYIFYCSIEGSSGYAGLAEAGCAQAGWNQTPYSTLIDLLENGH